MSFSSPNMCSLQHLGEADDGVQRRAQLVRHVGEELGLVLVGGLELAALVLDLVEQAHVLDRDHRLVGEGLQQRDLLVGERPHFRAGNRIAADTPCPPARSGTASAPQLPDSRAARAIGELVERGGPQVLDVHGPTGRGPRGPIVDAPGSTATCCVSATGSSPKPVTYCNVRRRTRNRRASARRTSAPRGRDRLEDRHARRSASC